MMFTCATDPSARPNNYGNLRSATAVDGLELLIQDEAARMAAGEDEEDDDAWDMHKHGNDSGSDSDDWIDLEEELGPEVSDDDEGGEDDSDNDSGAGAGAGAGASAVDDATLAAARKKVMARVLTPRDFARIAELRAGAGGTKRPRPDDSESGAVTVRIVAWMTTCRVWGWGTVACWLLFLFLFLFVGLAWSSHRSGTRCVFCLLVCVCDDSLGGVVDGCRCGGG
mgnify:CR=1 FL=1